MHSYGGRFNAVLVTYDTMRTIRRPSSTYVRDVIAVTLRPSDTRCRSISRVPKIRNRTLGPWGVDFSDDWTYSYVPDHHLRLTMAEFGAGDEDVGAMVATER